MAKPNTNLIKFFGWNVQGDMGPWTFYTSRRGNVVFYDRAPPLSPPSLLQKIERQKFADAGAMWKSLSDEGREKWNEAVRRCNLRITGYNLFTFWMVKDDLPVIQTIERATGLNLVGGPQ